MEIVVNKYNSDKTTKQDIEKVQEEKQETKLIGRYLRRKGLKLYSYNYSKNEIKEVKVTTKDIITLRDDLSAVDLGLEEANVDSRNTHFEALNLKNAHKRVSNYINGSVKELCNLRVNNPEGIKFY